MASEVRACARCGCSTQQNHAAMKAGRPAICKDCRAGDPAYVQALRTGVPLVARRAS
jgi:hypothetical protein